MNIWRACFLALGVVWLCGCDRGSIRNPFPVTFQIAAALLNPPERPVDPRSVLTKDQIEAAGVPILVIHAMDTSGVFILMDRVTSGRFNRWGELGGGEVIFDGSFPFRTHAFGADLLSVDARETRRALALRAPANVERRHSYLNGANEVETVAFRCQLIPVGPREIVSLGHTIPVFLIEEECVFEAQTVRNMYWLDAEGQVVRQRVWLTPGLGRLEFEFLSR